MDIEWREVVGYEGLYEVSNLGEVRSLARRVGCSGGRTRVRKPRLLYPFMSAKEYWRVTLTDPGGTKKSHRLHHVVATAFLGDRPPGLLALHRDDDKSHNALSNLYYGTHKQNVADATRNGKRRTVVSLGERHGSSRLKEKDIPKILEMRAAGMSGAAIARSFGVHGMTIHGVLRGMTWGWLTGIPNKYAQVA